MALPVNIDGLVNHRKVEWARIEYKEGWNPDPVPYQYRTSTGPVPAPVQKLLSALKNGPLSPAELRVAIGIQHRQTFRENYINSAIRADLICAEDGLSPHNPRIRYSLADKGISVLNEVAEKVAEKQSIGTEKPSVEPEKQPIGGEELHIGTEELHIESALTKLDITQPTKENILKLIQSFGTVEIFGRSEICKATGLQERAASYLIGKMLRHRLLDAVTGHGKGKYRLRSFDNGDTAKEAPRCGLMEPAANDEFRRNEA